MHAHTHAHTHKHIHMHLHKHTCTPICTHINTQWRYTREHMHMHINPHMHKHTYPHKCMHTHTQQRWMQSPPSQGYMEAFYRPQAWYAQKQEGMTGSVVFSENSEKLREAGMWGVREENQGGDWRSCNVINWHGVHREATWMGWGGGGKIILFGTGFSLTTCLFIFLPKPPERAPPKPCHLIYHIFQNAKWTTEHETGLCSPESFRCQHFNLPPSFTLEKDSKVVSIPYVALLIL